MGNLGAVMRQCGLSGPWKLCGLCGPPRAQSAGTAGTTPQPTAWASGSTGGLRWLRGAAGARAGVRQEGTVRFEVTDSFYRAHSKVIRCEPRPPLPEPRKRDAGECRNADAKGAESNHLRSTGYRLSLSIRSL